MLRKEAMRAVQSIPEAHSISCGGGESRTQIGLTRVEVDLYASKNSSTLAWLRPKILEMDKRPLTLGHSPDPDDAFMFFGLAKDLVPCARWKFVHILQDIQTLNERATRGELDITAI